MAIDKIESAAVGAGGLVEDTFTGDNSTTAFTLTQDVPENIESALLVTVNGVTQSNDSFSISGSGGRTLTLSEAPMTDSEIRVLHLNPGVSSTYVVASGSVTNDKIQSGTIQTAKLADDAVTSAKIAAGIELTTPSSGYSLTVNHTGIDTGIQLKDDLNQTGNMGISNAGHFYMQNDQADGSFIFDTASKSSAFRIYDEGYAVAGEAVGYFVRNNSHINIPQGTALTALQDLSGAPDPLFSISSGWTDGNMNLSTGVYTAPVDGVYRFGCSILVNHGGQTANTYHNIRIFLNGTTQIGHTGLSSRGSNLSWTYQRHYFDVQYELSAGDYIEYTIAASDTDSYVYSSYSAWFGNLVS